MNTLHTSFLFKLSKSLPCFWRERRREANPFLPFFFSTKSSLPPSSIHLLLQSGSALEEADRMLPLSIGWRRSQSLYEFGLQTNKKLPKEIHGKSITMQSLSLILTLLLPLPLYMSSVSYTTLSVYFTFLQIKLQFFISSSSQHPVLVYDLGILPDLFVIF